MNKNIKEGVHWSTDFGLLQVNDFYHKKDMEKLGLDYWNPVDSYEYGKMLYERDGTRHWKASSKCQQALLAEKAMLKLEDEKKNNNPQGTPTSK